MMRDVLAVWASLMLLVAYMDLVAWQVKLSARGWLRAMIQQAITATLLGTLGTEGVLLTAVYAASMGWLVYTFPYRFDAHREDLIAKLPRHYRRRD